MKTIRKSVDSMKFKQTFFHFFVLF